MMMLSKLIDAMLPKTRLIVFGYDAEQNKTWRAFNGYKFQFIIGGHLEDCNIISLTNDLVTGAVVLVVDAHFDNFRGCK